MNLGEYQNQAEQFANRDLPEKTAVAVWALGLCGEAGEAADHIKKWLGHGHDLDLEKIEKELGDVLWYLAMLAASLDLSLEDIADENIHKLSNRYGDGFSVEKSKNRSEQDA